MYATSSSTEVFHLVNSGGSTSTLCGLRVVPIVIDRPAKTGTLHLRSDRPTDHELCEVCAKIELEKQREA